MTGEKYRAELVAHFNLGGKGSLRVSKLIDHPDVVVSEKWEKQERKTTRIINVGDEEFPTVSAAIEYARGKK